MTRWPIVVFSLVAAAGRAGAQESADGKTLYMENCGSCHMPAGTGVPREQPALGRGNRIVVGDPSRLIRLVLEGTAVLPQNRPRYENEMPTFESLTDGEIALVLTYVRSSFGNKAGAITAAQVAAVRAKR